MPIYLRMEETREKEQQQTAQTQAMLMQRIRRSESRIK